MTKHLIRFLVTVSCLFIGSALALAQEVPPYEPVPDEDTTVETSIGEVDPYSVYSRGQIQETYIDEDYKLYDVRPYKGVVPGHPERGSARKGRPSCLSPRPPPRDRCSLLEAISVARTAQRCPRSESG